MTLSPRRIYWPSQFETDEIQRLRAYASQAADMLRGPKPDTFLGRKTQEPFRQETAAEIKS